MKRIILSMLRCSNERLTSGWVAAAATYLMLSTVVNSVSMSGSVADFGRRLLMISVLKTCIQAISSPPTGSHPHTTPLAEIPYGSMVYRWPSEIKGRWLRKDHIKDVAITMHAR